MWDLPSRRAAWRIGGQSCIDAEVVQQPVIGEAHHVAAIPFARLLQRAGLESDVAQGKSLQPWAAFRCERIEAAQRRAPAHPQRRCGRRLLQDSERVCARRRRCGSEPLLRQSAKKRRCSGQTERDDGGGLCELSATDFFIMIPPIQANVYQIEPQFRPTDRSYFKSRQFGPNDRSATSGTFSLTTPSISARTSAATSSVSSAALRRAIRRGPAGPCAFSVFAPPVCGRAKSWPA